LFVNGFTLFRAPVARIQNFRGLATPVCARAVSPSTPR